MSLTTKSLSAGYGRSTVIADISITLPDCAVTALIGPNGSGKSTLLRAIAGLQASRGELLIDGEPVDRTTAQSAVAYMPQDTSSTSSLTMLEVVLLGRLRSLGLSIPMPMLIEADAALARFGIAQLASRPLSAVSGGQRQLAYLAQALFRQPRILLLDEPTAALDLRHQLIVLETIRTAAREDKIIVVVAMHDLSLAAQFADNFLCLAEGRIDAAGRAGVVLTPDRIQRVYGVEADITAGVGNRLQITPLRAT